MMLVTRKSIISGKEHTLAIDCTPEQLATYAAGGTLIQEVFPTLSPEEREFIKTGSTPEEWDNLFS